MKSLILFSVLAFVIGIGFGLYILNDDSAPEPPFARMNVGGDFLLHDGEREVRLSDYHGKVVLIFFGYTSCPDICPTTMASISAALKNLTENELKKVQVLFVSIDPDRDTTDTLKQFTAYFHPNILGITGSAEELDLVVKQYGSAYRKISSDSVLGYLVDHSAAIYVVNTEGELTYMLAGSEPVPEIVKSIRGLM